MIIHVVQSGETIEAIAQSYGMSAENIIRDNGIINPDNLAVGQAILIVYPYEVYTIQEGDTLEGIASAHNVTVMQLLRNNPYLSDQEFIYPGETIIISYDDTPKPDITTNGYAFPYIEVPILRKTLPYLTYLSIFSYSISAEGELTVIEDTDLIKIAKEYGVAPIMVISNVTEAAPSGSVILHNLLNNQQKINSLIEQILTVLRAKGYYGLTIDIPYIPPEDKQLFNDFIVDLSDRLHSEDYKIFITIPPTTLEKETETRHEIPNFTIIEQKVDLVNLTSYSWGRSYDFTVEMVPFYVLRLILNLINTSGLIEKTTISISIIGYIWSIPYIEGESAANAITNQSAVLLASENGATIYYNQTNKNSYFYIFNYEGKNYFINFTDVRGIDDRTKLVPEYGLNGISIWNIMDYFAQMYLYINTQYAIIKVYN